MAAPYPISFSIGSAAPDRLSSESDGVGGARQREKLLDFGADARLLEESVGPLCESFVKNNEKSGSFATLLSIITSLIKQITSEKSGQKSGDACEALFNSLLILKTLVKYIVQHVPLDQCPSFFVTSENIPAPPASGDPDVSPTVLKQVARYETSADELLFYLFEYITTQAVGDGNVETHNECLQIVTILCSAHLYHPSTTTSPYLAILSEGRCSSLAELLVRTLLERAVTEREQVQTSSALWTYLMGSPALLCPYYSRDCLLLLVLLTSHTGGVYRGILDSAGHKEPGTNTTRETSFVIDMELVYLFFCKETISEEKTLLLYTLVQFFCPLPLSDQILVPLIEQLLQLPASLLQGVQPLVVEILIPCPTIPVQCGRTRYLGHVTGYQPIRDQYYTYLLPQSESGISYTNNNQSELVI
eukprot:sb/3465071/